jgi:PAS domain S-box-containing protein
MMGMVAILMIGNGGMAEEPTTPRPLPRVLIVYSYHLDMPWVAELNRGFVSTFAGRAERVVMQLDVKRFPDHGRESAMAETLRWHAAMSHPAVVVPVDDYAYDFVLRHRDLVPDVPIVFCGVNSAPDHVPPGVTGVIEPVRQLAGTLDLMFMFHPQAKRLVVVNDQTETGRANDRSLRDMRSHWGGREVVHLGSGTFAEVEGELACLSPRDDVVLLLSWNLDATGAVRDYETAVRRARAVCLAPIYGIWRFYLGGGIVGGNLLDGEAHATEAAGLVLRILAGENPSRIPVVEQGTTTTGFDQRELDRFGIPDDKLPTAAVVVHPHHSFVRENWGFILSTVVVITAQSVTIVWLLVAERRRRRAEQRAAESDLHLRSLFAGAPIGMFRSVPDGRLLAVNPAMAAMFGYESPDMMIAQVNRIGISISIYDDPEQRQFVLAELTEAAGQWIERETRFRRRDGSLIDTIMSVSLRPDPLTREPVLSGFIQDMTVRRQQEMERRRFERLSALGQLAGGVAHDFNNMLAGILGYADLIVSRTTDERSRTYAGKIVDAVDRARDLTGGLLRFSRQGSEVAVSYQAHEAIVAAVDLFGASRAHHIQVICRLEASRHRVRGFPSQLQNAVLNLCLNARDAMLGGGTISITSDNIDIAAEDVTTWQPYTILPGSYVRIAVSDTGSGMLPDVLAHCLEPFFTTKGDKGTGLGLPSVHGAVSDHHGAMHITSHPGQGTTFVLVLPLTSGSQSGVQSVVHVTTPVAGTRRGPVLVVDDAANLRLNQIELLTDFGFPALGFEDGPSVIAWVREHPGAAALVLLDMDMPKMHGDEVFDVLRSIDATLPVIVTSGSVSSVAIQQMLERGLLSALRKPTQAKELIEHVGRVVGIPEQS